MPTYSKIPALMKEIGVIASGHYAVFCKGLLKAGSVFTRLQKREDKGREIPLVGYFTVKGERIYYCRYGLVDEPDIYKK